MSTLYVSDLDGTLFNKKKAISEKSAEILNKCLDKGMQFAVATARMPYKTGSTSYENAWNCNKWSFSL